jgi:DNA-directed RNA polymerase specialized sigma24 family protein
VNLIEKIVSAPNSYREVAQYFDGVSRQAIKGWVFRNKVPEKHWHNLLRICEEYNLPITEEQIRAYARDSGQRLSMVQAKEALQCNWVSVRKRLLKYAATFTKDNDERLDAVHDGMLAMMNAGTTAPEYGYSCVRCWFLRKWKHYKEDTTADEEWLTIESLHPIFARQDDVLETIEIVEAIKEMPVRYRELMYLMAKEFEDHELAEFLGVSHDSVRSYKSHARQLLKRILEDRLAVVA